MTARISIETLRAAALSSFPEPATSSVPPMSVRHSDLLALVEAVEAAQAFCALATRTGYLVGPIEYVDLTETLARFDFGGEGE